MKFTRLIYLSLWTVTMSCSQSEKPPSFTAALIDQNDLVPEQSESYVQKIGSLTNGKSNCTAFLTGPSELSTAAHCVETADLKSFRFNIANRLFKLKSRKLNRKTGFASLVVDGNFENYFEFDSLKSDAVTLVAYDYQNHELASHKSCRVNRDLNYKGLLVHTCDSVAGMSGSPLLQQGKVVGIHLGSLPLNQANGALEATYRDDSKMNLPLGLIKPEGLFGKCNPWCDSDGISDPTTEQGNALGKVKDNTARVLGVARDHVERSAEGIERFVSSIKVDENMLYDAYITASLLYNGSACVISATTAPGFAARTDPGTVYCGANACLCAFGAAAAIYQKNQYFIEHGGMAKPMSNSEILNSDPFVNASKDIDNQREGLVAALGIIPQGFFGVPNDAIYWSNGGDAYCWVPHPKYISGPIYGYKLNVHGMTTMRRDGACPGMI